MNKVVILNDNKCFYRIAVQISCCKSCFTVAIMMKQNISEESDKLSTGCSILDAFFRGGIPCRGITEISGESASGKTQLCIQLCLTSQLNYTYGGLNTGKYFTEVISSIHFGIIRCYILQNVTCIQYRFFLYLYWRRISKQATCSNGGSIEKKMQWELCVRNKLHGQHFHWARFRCGKPLRFPTIMTSFLSGCKQS